MEKVKILADENIGGENLEYVKKILKDEGIEVIPFPEEFRRKSMQDEEVLDKLNELGCDGIISADVGMIRKAIKRKVRVFWLIIYSNKDEKEFIVCEVKGIGGVRIKIKMEYFKL